MINLRRFGNGASHFCNCPERIENYDKAIADTENMWCCHHRLATHRRNGTKRKFDIPKKVLIQFGIYFNRPPEEFIFLTKSEHDEIHKFGLSSRGIVRSEEWKRKQSQSHKGKTSPRKGAKLSKETKNKIAKQFKGKHWKIVDGKRMWY